MADKLDIFEVLSRVDNIDLDYIKGLTEEEMKTDPPYLMMLWMSGTNSKMQILRINSFMNPFVFDLGNSHKRLLFMMACVATDSQPKRYKWIKKKTGVKKYPTAVEVLRQYYSCSSTVALEYLNLLNYEDVEHLALELGEQDETLKKIKKELK